ncbi:hypothetical protein RZS08_31210, partial [Arthrospira platensis SPKY1]|nr:hypothetical protein [Arthrospira platensis SPKY1]
MAQQVQQVQEELPQQDEEVAHMAGKADQHAAQQHHRIDRREARHGRQWLCGRTGDARDDLALGLARVQAGGPLSSPGLPQQRRPEAVQARHLGERPGGAGGCSAKPTSHPRQARSERTQRPVTVQADAVGTELDDIASLRWRPA